MQSTPFHDWLVQLRRHFHQFPELAYREERTAAKIVEVLQDYGVPVMDKIGGTGVIASLCAQRGGPTVAMRADMDALPLEELNDVSYRSRHGGVMHACGHDAHTAIMLGVVRHLVETGWPEKGAGKILFIFQPAEEGGAGARAMLESGVLDSERIAAIFAGHVQPELPVGRIGFSPDVSNAASETIDIRLTGKGGHGAQPHHCIDPIVAGASLVTQLQSIISRCIAPVESAVLTIGSFHAGTARNIIPEEAFLEGTLRTINSRVREEVLGRLGEMVKGLEAAYRVGVSLKTSVGYPLLVNDANLVHFVEEQVAEVLGESCVHRGGPRMGSEDFAFFAQKFPGILIRLGCSDPEKEEIQGLHSPYFDLDERVLDVGVRLFSHLLTRYAARA